ncbi:MAG TPA: hypothetical protein VG895_01420 [Patescibacteria group bacterium]|nr:hypothetical protein [Patescibacteria group bacterium]
MEDYSFKKFEGVGQRLENRITITSNKSFGLPTKFYIDEQVGNNNYLVIYYDENKKVVALHFTNLEEEPNKFTIMKNPEGKGASVIATSFFKTYNIDTKAIKGRYTWEKRELEGIGVVYIIKLP